MRFVQVSKSPPQIRDVQLKMSCSSSFAKSSSSCLDFTCLLLFVAALFQVKFSNIARNSPEFKFIYFSKTLSYTLLSSPTPSTKKTKKTERRRVKNESTR